MSSKVKTVIRYILSVVLALAIIVFLLANLAKTTILDKNYVLGKLDKTSYYVKLYGYIKENVKNYIPQSGFDESIIDGVITEEQVKTDTKKVITNIYNDINEKITAEEIKTKLSENIKKATSNMIITTEQQKSIDDFINHISSEYLTGIAHFDFESSIHSIIKKADKAVDFANKALLIVIAVDVIALLVISLNRFYKFFVFTGISCFSSGLFFLIANIFINSKINVQTITILNDAFSFTLRDILGEVLNTVKTNGLYLLISGIILIIVPNLIHNFFKYKNLR